MTSEKGLSGVVVIRRKHPFILISVAMLVIFLIIASQLLVSYPSSNIHEYVLGSYFTKSSTVVPKRSSTSGSGEIDVESLNGTVPLLHTASASIEEHNVSESPIIQKGTEETGIFRPSPALFSNASENTFTSGNSTFSAEVSSGVFDGSGKNKSGNCDLYHGKWVSDPAGPLYTNNTCPIITQMQNCQGNGRPDKDYENWRWKPDQCHLPRFDARKFLELMRGKTLAFVGDSVSRNQMESLMCILWQVEVPKNRGNRRMHRWYFRSTSTMIVRIWSSWLVHQTTEPIDFTSEDVTKLHLDAPDNKVMELLPSFDVVVLSSGHWFAKKSAYVLDNKIVGGQLWWPDKSRRMKTNNVKAFGLSVETILSAIATHPNFTGLTIVRSFSPDHYEGGAWNTGGSCTGKSSPATELVRNGFTDVMHKKQVMGFQRAVKKAKNNGSKLKLMDITDVFGYRHDGHPGPYRSPDPNKKTKRGPNGEPPPQDCLHWCMPGPVDTWNELVMEIIRRDFEGA